jgi:hypothetical protein
MKSVVEKAVATRMAGERASRLPALVTACAAAAAAGVIVYKLLRSGSGGDSPEQAS